MKTFLFRVVLESHPKVWRTILCVEGQTLHDLHCALQESFGLKGDRLYAFYMSRTHWDQDHEYGGPSSGSAKKAAKTRLSELGLEKGGRFLYVYDFDKEFWFEIECIDEGVADPKESYPRIVERSGEFPLRRPQPHFTGELKNLVPMLNQAIDTWQATRGGKPRSQAVVAKEYQIVRKLYDVLKTNAEERWVLLEEATDSRLVDWLLSLPSDMALRGMGEEALTLCDYFSAFADKEYFLSEKALVLAKTGKRDKALALIHENLSNFPRTARLLAKAAEAYWKLNEVGTAERLYRTALDLAADDISEREEVLKGLVAMLEENERSEEAAELLSAELDRS